MQQNDFSYTGEKFADLQMLRYRLKGFESLTLKQKTYIYCLAKAALYGRDITFDQQGKYNLSIRKLLETVYTNYPGERDSADFKALEVYLKRVWFSSGIYHHYGCEKFSPDFSEAFLKEAVEHMDEKDLPMKKGETKDEFVARLFPVIFDPDVLPKRVNQADGEDLVKTSACNFYEGVTQEEVEKYYQAKKSEGSDEQPSWGLNSKLIRRNGLLTEQVWCVDGMYSEPIRLIARWLQRAGEYAENDEQRHVIDLLVKYYRTGDLTVFDQYSIAWVRQQEGMVDFINGFIEVYGDPLGLKGTWEGLVEYKNLEATRRTQTIAGNAQWFEDHSPVNPNFRKPVVKGVSAHVICAAMLGGDEYPASAIGINLPNANWIRQAYGSKSVTIGNLTEAYNKAAHGNGFLEEFVDDEDTLYLVRRYGDQCDDLHTDLHECLGHGSGRLAPGTDPDALKAYGNTIEEARADLFGLYFMADPKLVELGLLPDGEAYKSQYYTYLLNGLLTQTVRIKPGADIEEAHMRNRALIAWWALDLCNAADGTPAARIVERGGKHFVKVDDYGALRGVFAQELCEIQRIKSMGDYEAARSLVEKYAVRVDQGLHAEMLQRYGKLGIAPYKGFVNPHLTLAYDAEGNVADVLVDYSESFAEQNLRYSKEYATLI